MKSNRLQNRMGLNQFVYYCTHNLPMLKFGKQQNIIRGHIMFSGNNLYSMCFDIVKSKKKEISEHNLTDAQKALKDAGLLNERNLDHVMQHDDYLTSGLCWLRNEKLLTQEALDTLLNSVKPSRFADIFCRLAQNDALTRETYLKFSAIGQDADHIDYVYEILTILSCRYGTDVDRKKLSYLINQLDNPQTAKEVFRILYGLNIHFREHKFREFPSVALDLLTKPQNKVTWSGIADVICEIQYGSSTSEEIQKLANAEIDRIAKLAVDDPQLRAQRAQTIEAFFNLFSPKAAKEEIKEQVRPGF
jgi:hypothetical protein